MPYLYRSHRASNARPSPARAAYTSSRSVRASSAEARFAARPVTSLRARLGPLRGLCLAASLRLRQDSLVAGNLLLARSSSILREVPADRTQLAIRPEHGAFDDAAGHRGVEVFTFGRRDGDVRHALVAEEEEVAGARRGGRASFQGLLVGVAVETHPVQTVHELAEAGAVDSIDRRAAPEVRRAEKALGRAQEIRGKREAVGQLRDVDGVAERDPPVDRDAQPVTAALLDRERRGHRETIDDRRGVGRGAAHVGRDDADDAALGRPDLVEHVREHPAEVMVRSLRVEPVALLTEQREALAVVRLVDALR